jgi:hypothetical protein
MTDSPKQDQDQQKEEGGVSPLTEITSAALAKIGMSDEDATALLGDESLMKELREAHSLIREAVNMKRDADSVLVEALVSEGVNMSDEDIQRMMKDLGEKDDEAYEGADAENEQLELDTSREDQAEFGNLIEQLTKMALKADEERKNSKNNKTKSDNNNQIAISFLPVLPLIAEYCGAAASLTTLSLVCRTWRGLLLSDNRAIQRTLWIAIACNEFPFEVSELGEDAFVSVVSWSDLVQKFIESSKKKK